MTTRWTYRWFDVEEYLDDAVGILKVAHGGRGTELICECPFCGKNKLYVNKESAFFTCYACGEGGSIVGIVAAVEGLSFSAARAVVMRDVNRKLSRSLKEIRARNAKRDARVERDREKETRERAALPPEYIPIWDALNPKKIVHHSYLERRGVSLRTARDFRIGYCDEGIYGGYVILPAVENGEVVTFTARATGDWEPKYLNPPIVEKGRHIYGFDLIAGQADAVVVEGPTDVLGMYKKGYRTCAFLGKTATHRQIEKVRSTGVKSLTILFDGGTSAEALKTAKAAADLMPVKIATLPGTFDPDDAPAEIVAKALADAREPSARDFRATRPHVKKSPNRRLGRSPRR